MLTPLADTSSGVFIDDTGGIKIFVLEGSSPHALKLWHASMMEHICHAPHTPCLLLHDFTSPRFTGIPGAVKLAFHSFKGIRRDKRVRMALVVPYPYYLNVLKSIVLQENYVRPDNVEEMVFWKKEYALHWLEAVS